MSMISQCSKITKTLASHVLKAKMLLDTPIAAAHGSLVAYPQKCINQQTRCLGLKAL